MFRRPLEELPEWRNPENLDQEEMSRRDMMGRVGLAILAIGLPTIVGIHGCMGKKPEHKIRFRETIDLNEEKKPAPKKDTPPPPPSYQPYA